VCYAKSLDYTIIQVNISFIFSQTPINGLILYQCLLFDIRELSLRQPVNCVCLFCPDANACIKYEAESEVQSIGL